MSCHTVHFIRFHCPDGLYCKGEHEESENDGCDGNNRSFDSIIHLKLN